MTIHYSRAGARHFSRLAAKSLWFMATRQNPTSTYFLKYPKNYDFPAHSHTSAERMTLLSGAMNVNYRGQPTTVLKTGMYAYGPAKAVHDGRCVSDEPCVLFIAFEQPLDAIEFVKPAQ